MKALTIVHTICAILVIYSSGNEAIATNWVIGNTTHVINTGKLDC